MYQALTCQKKTYFKTGNKNNLTEKHNSGFDKKKST